MGMSVLLDVKNLKKHFPVKEGLLKKSSSIIHAVDGVSFNVLDGETFGLVGESGCGKTTLARVILRLIEPTAGEVSFLGNDIFKLNRNEIRELRSEMQIVFQDPFASLNPRKRIGQILSKPFKIHTKMGKDEIERRVLSLIESVGLTPASSYINRHPHEFSGGQRQRIGIARAMALQPKFIIADEPISSLDLSIRANIINLMKKFQREMGISYLFITHDLSIVRSICNRVAVMYLGKIVELAEVNELFNNPFHPYTKALLSATPVPDPVLSRSRKKEIIEGEVASPIDPPSGCRFHPRCPFSTPTCSSVEPELVDIKDSHFVACYLSAV